MVSRVSISSLALTALAGLMLASTAACAADGPHAGFETAGADGVLTGAPSHPPAGTCYATVKVLKDVEAPPPGAHAVWRQTPALPGALGPTWCLVMEPGHDTPSVDQLERVGWVRVLCDTDITPDRVRGLQRKLHAHGEYQGEETGRYDQTTADAVARFQRERKIDHGGYLSQQTVEAIEHAEARHYAEAEVRGDDAYALGRPGPLPPIHVTGCCAPPPPPVQVRVPVPYPVEVRVPVPQPYPVEVRVPVPQPYPVEVRVPVPQPYPVYVPQPRPYPVYVQQPCCAAPPPPPVQPCCAPPPQPCCQGGGQGYGPQGPYQGPARGPDYTQPYGQHAGYLNWAGKTLY
ncbi:hypothetical protein BH09PSE2_BH09PSE2_06480 [soil metagenome]